MLHTLLAILLLEGFVTISVEILTIRQLLPFFGGSVVITSIIIGFFLLFLALGYWRGGMHSSDFYKKLNRNFMVSVIWIGIGLNYSFIGSFFEWTINRLSLPFLASLTLYLLLVLAPVVFWLGQTIPLTTNLFSQEQRVSRISGKALFLSTLGSFSGALVTSLLLFQFAGVAWTVVVNCTLLFLLVILLKPQSGLAWPLLILLGLALYFIKLLNVNYEQQFFKLTNNYGNYEILTAQNARLLRINLSGSSMITEKKEGFAYIEFIRHFLFNQLQLQHKRILVIGAGGFSLTAAGTHANDVTYVDIDPQIKSVAEKHFLEGKIHGRFIGQDARRYLNETREQFDVIVADAYSHQQTIPASLLTADYFAQLASHLKPSGLLVVNLITNPLFNSSFSKRVHNTILSIFPFCNVVPLDWKKLSNVIYICPRQGKDDVIYSDNLTGSTFDFYHQLQSSQ
ncbi:hypothetical protein GH742_14470 [Legionella sp. MW5194]|uniref:fused MFS/spermidine synthase n=1 Tax=Legionella sp. MW5194 TaxID=2662448 RepID=UPI00193D1C7E|nr:fused MFS/spermidine synthase [Legionella sp. MW5194]QRN04970.1 hypothetical protein GH742_14470 [Legionella sp. MW5194]